MSASSTRKKASPRKSKLAPLTKRRIGHIYELGPLPPDDTIPRGWITPKGEFLRTKKHWVAIAHQMGETELDDTEVGERSAHRAYAEGWMSVGHGGVLNAIAHETTWRSLAHPTVVRLREALEGIPHQVFRVEKQCGDIDGGTGRHEDFDIAEYDLEYFLRRGKLRKS